MDFNRFKKDVAQFFKTRIASATPILVLSSLMVTAYISNPVVAVEINGKFIGYVESQTEFEQEILKVEKMATEILGSPYSIEIEEQYKLTYGKSNDILPMEQAEEILSSYVSEIATLAVIKVDGESVVATKTVAEARQALDNLISGVAGEENLQNAKFVENVEVVEELSDISLLRTTDGAQEALMSTEKGEAVHKVSQNETLSQIAQNYGMKTAEVTALNPTLVPEKIQIGQEILIEKAQPAISIEVTKQESYSKSVSYKTTTTYDDTMTTSQKKTVTKGVAGENKIVAEVTYVNGTEVAREIISETVLREPVNEVVSVGTKKAVSTGSFRMPTSGKISSKYGYRSGGFHTGIDIATSYGKTIVASDGGKVVFSGWNGGYGNCVIIDHGNGIETVYAHNSRNTVKKGDQVSKGDKIAEIGSTGNSTGNHVHFEVRKNGKHQNPYNYLG